MTRSKRSVLELNREVVRNLAETELAEVAAGSLTDITTTAGSVCGLLRSARTTCVGLAG
jgi:hypothetical protein